MLSSFLSLFVSLLLLETTLAVCKFKFIHNASELIEFSNDVNNGTNYEGYTVYLVSDINFNEESSKQYDPIGKNPNIGYFAGVFDGQGYVISNLTMNPSSLFYVGLFGYSYGMTIKNVIVDDSCSFTDSYSGSTYTYLYIAGVICFCNAFKGSCIYENIVNMADVSYSGITSKYLWVGGVAGHIYIWYSNYKSNIINCVNYGNLYNYGTSDNDLYMGGIIAEIYPGVKNYANFIYNCINYGKVQDRSTASKYFHIGGVVGLSWGSAITNCVNIGTVTSSKGTVGGIVGNAYNTYYTTITHCYWATDACSNYLASSSYISSSEINGITSTSITSDNADWLNTYAILNNWSNWTYNQNKVKSPL